MTAERRAAIVGVLAAGVLAALVVLPGGEEALPIAWGPSEGALGYRVWLVDADSSGPPLVIDVGGLTAVDVPLGDLEGVDYWQVSAYSAVGLESGRSRPVWLVPVEGPRFEAVVTVYATDTLGGEWSVWSTTVFSVEGDPLKDSQYFRTKVEMVPVE